MFQQHDSCSGGVKFTAYRIVPETPINSPKQAGLPPMPTRGEEFKDDFRRALPKELVQRLSRISAWRSAWSVVQAILRPRAIAEHGATTDFSSPPTTARTNLVPVWLGWLIFPHRVNYHVEHHLYASVPQYNLPELHRELASRGLLAGAEVTPFGTTLGKIFADRTQSAVPLNAA